ncbi:DNA helicase II, partial [Salmonella enterica]
MDVSYLLDSLNDKQREAVAAPRSNMLVLAGAGSGENRGPGHRVGRVMSVESNSPFSTKAGGLSRETAGGRRHRAWPRVGTHPAGEGGGGGRGGGHDRARRGRRGGHLSR